MRHLTWSSGRLLILPLLLANGACTCTEIGCMTGFFVEADLVTPGVWTATVTADGVTSTCTAEVPFTGDSGSGDTGSGDTGSGDSGSEGPSCDGPLSWGLPGAEPADGDSSIHGLVYGGTATTISLVLTRDGEPVYDETFTPTWEDQTLNGPRCGVACTTASVSIGSF